MKTLVKLRRQELYGDDDKPECDDFLKWLKYRHDNYCLEGNCVSHANDDDTPR